MAKRLYRQQVNTVRSQNINIDNGAGTTLDEALFKVGARGGSIVRVYALYNEAAGTVAAANFKLGSAAGGAQYVAATAYTDSAAIGAVTSAALVTDEIPANGTVFLRHTGIATTALGTVFICVEYVDNK
jgi:hypothetical protein